MLEREPLLKAIFADTDNPLPRLVFADWLDDHGDHVWAELLRLACDLARRQAVPDDPVAIRVRELLATAPDAVVRLFSDLTPQRTIEVTSEQLLDPDGLRRLTCDSHPYWYGATTLKVTAGCVATREAIETLLRSPVTEHVNTLVLAGREEQTGTAHDETLGLGLIDFVLKPAITPRMVEHLVGLREARRLVALDLSRNDLDNDAVRAVARSNYLTRLTDLAIQDNNARVKGRVWSELLGRFGPEVVR